MKADPVPGQISSLYLYLRQAVEQSGSNFDKAIEGDHSAPYKCDARHGAG